MSTATKTIDALCVDTIRTLAIDAIQKAESGHPGLPLGAAPMAYVLWQRHLKHNPRDPRWADRDRFVLSAGHGCMLLYSLLHLTGYDVSLDDLKHFRQWGSKTPGHPETLLTPGVEATTGPLGQGTANAVGMAIAERLLAHRFNRPGFDLVDHRTFALVSDGDLMEGISGEASSLAGHLRLGKLTFIYDSNEISLDGPTSITYTEDAAKRYEAYGWQVLHVDKGDTDLEAIDRALTQAAADASRPTLIVVRTTIGYGSPNKAGTSDAHGSPLGPQEVELTKKALGWESAEPFAVPAQALAHFRSAVDRGGKAQEAWDARFADYEREFPELAEQWRRAQAGDIVVDFVDKLPMWQAGEKEATRVAAGKALNVIAEHMPELVGGDADLSVSTNTRLKAFGSFDGQTGSGRNIHFGVREHAMGSIANGMAYHGGVRPFTSTFFAFSDYMRPAIRLAALNELPVIYIWTHDSIALGEDGPTHQPVEHLMSLRAMPGLTLIRPADANEAVAAWRMAIGHRQGPVGIVLSRQKLPVIDRVKYGRAAGLVKGAYILAEAAGGAPGLILIATGSEVALALEAREKLEAGGTPTRVVSMPSWELFEAQPAEYRESVLPPEIRARVAIEAGVTLGWHKWVGDRGDVIGLDRYGASAPADVLAREFGFTAENVVARAEAVLAALKR